MVAMVIVLLRVYSYIVSIYVLSFYMCSNFQYNDLSDVEPGVFKQLIELKSL